MSRPCPEPGCPDNAAPDSDKCYYHTKRDEGLFDHVIEQDAGRRMIRFPKEDGDDRGSEMRVMPR